jgi:hypothetical protein
MRSSALRAAAPADRTVRGTDDRASDARDTKQRARRSRTAGGAQCNGQPAAVLFSARRFHRWRFFQPQARTCSRRRSTILCGASARLDRSNDPGVDRGDGGRTPARGAGGAPARSLCPRRPLRRRHGRARDRTAAGARGRGSFLRAYDRYRRAAGAEARLSGRQLGNDVARPRRRSLAAPPAEGSPGSAFAGYRGAIRRYVPAPYEGHVVVLRPENHPDTRPAMGWTAFAPGAQTVVVAGDHLTVITRHLEATAAQVRSCLQIPT